MNEEEASQNSPSVVCCLLLENLAFPFTLFDHKLEEEMKKETP